MKFTARHAFPHPAGSAALRDRLRAPPKNHFIQSILQACLRSIAHLSLEPVALKFPR